MTYEYSICVGCLAEDMELDDEELCMWCSEPFPEEEDGDEDMQYTIWK